MVGQWMRYLVREWRPERVEEVVKVEMKQEDEETRMDVEEKVRLPMRVLRSGKRISYCWLSYYSQRCPWRYFE